MGGTLDGCRRLRDLRGQTGARSLLTQATHMRPRAVNPAGPLGAHVHREAAPRAVERREPAAPCTLPRGDTRPLGSPPCAGAAGVSLVGGGDEVARRARLMRVAFFTCGRRTFGRMAAW